MIVSKLTSEQSEENMDATRYKSVAINNLSYSQLKDLSIYNKTPISKSAMCAYLIDKEWRQMFSKKPKKVFAIASIKKLFSRSSSEVSS